MEEEKQQKWVPTSTAGGFKGCRRCHVDGEYVAVQRQKGTSRSGLGSLP